MNDIWLQTKQGSYKDIPGRGAWWLSGLSIWTLDFGSGHDVRVIRWNPVWGSLMGMESASDSLPPSAFAPPPFSLSKTKDILGTLAEI